MVCLTPKCLPPLSLLLADLGNPQPSEIAKALGVTTRTVERWIADGRAPRPAHICLFWVSSWGAQAVNVQAFNDAREAYGLLACLQRENRNLVAELNSHANKPDRYGAANSPFAGEFRTTLQNLPAKLDARSMLFLVPREDPPDSMAAAL